MTTTSLTSTWSSRASERTFLTPLLQRHRHVSNLVVFGGEGQGKTSIVLDVLMEQQTQFAYVDAALAQADKYFLKRLTAQVMDPRTSYVLAQKLIKMGREGEDEESGSGVKKDPRGRKRKSLALSTTMDIPSHPDAMVEDIATRGGKDRTQAVSATAAGSAQMDVDLDGATSSAANGSGPISSVAAFTTSSAQNSTRSQLTELVRTISSLGHTAFKEQKQPETLYLVIDNVQRLQDHTSILTSLASLSAHTSYPVILVLIATDLSMLPHSDASLGMFGMPLSLVQQFMIVRFKPYTPKQLGEILGKKLWNTNRYVAKEFYDAFAATGLLNSKTDKKSASATSSPTSPSGLSPAQSSLALTCFSHFIENVSVTFHSILANQLYTFEQQIRRLLPLYLRMIKQELIQLVAKRGAVNLEIRSSSGGLDPTELNGRILTQMDKELKVRLANVWKIESTPAATAFVPVAEMDGGSPSKKAKPTTSPSLTAPPMSNPSSTTAGVGHPSPSRSTSSTAAKSLTTVFSESRLQNLILLPRTSKFLLLASFLASYNPPSADTTLFTNARKKSNRKGKSQALERKKSNFDSAKESNEAQIHQIQLGPNAAPLERILAIYSVIADEQEEGVTRDLNVGLSSCYSQLKSLLACHYCEQIFIGTGSGASSLASGKRIGDLLTGVKIRCLILKSEMEKLCETIDPRPIQTQNSLGHAQIKMGERITLNTYLYDGKRK